MANWMKFASAAVLSGLAGLAVAQVSVSIGGENVQIRNSGSSVSINQSGVIGPGVEMEGVAIINGLVYVDGVKIPKGTKEHKSAKTGKTYRIKWGGNGNVAVEEK